MTTGEYTMNRIISIVFALVAGFGGGAAFIVSSVPDEAAQVDRIIVPLAAFKTADVNEGLRRLGIVTDELAYPTALLLPQGDIDADVPLIIAHKNTGLYGPFSKRSEIIDSVYWRVLNISGCKTTFGGGDDLSEMPSCKGLSAVGKWLADSIIPRGRLLTTIRSSADSGIRLEGGSDNTMISHVHLNMTDGTAVRADDK
jgi:hypothetical protein